MEYSWLTHILKEQVKRVKFKEFEKERKINVYKFQLYTMQATFRTVQIPVLIFKGIKCWNITDLIMKNSKTLDSYDNIIQLIRYNSFSPPPNYQERLEIISYHLLYLEEKTVIIKIFVLYWSSNVSTYQT